MGSLKTIYMKSDNVRVFPTTKRPVYQKDSSLLTEANIVSIVNRLLDLPTFVISYKNDNLKFNLNGYYFQVSGISQIVESPEIGDALYANIRTIRTGDYIELYGTDENNYYSGLYFSLGEKSSVSSNGFKVLQYGKDIAGNIGWIVPKESYFKYNSRGFFGNIDCGEI